MFNAFVFQEIFGHRLISEFCESNLSKCQSFGRLYKEIKKYMYNGFNASLCEPHVKGFKPEVIKSYSKEYGC